MARKNKIGLDYFSHDVEMFNDIKIKFIKAKHGLIGYAIFLRLLENIYKENGYFIQIDDKFNILFADDNKLDIDVYINVLNDCINENLFNKEIYDKYKVLTSKRIQLNFLAGSERRKSIELKKEFLLLTDDLLENDNIKIIDVYINEIDSNISTQKEIESKKKIENESIYTETFNYYLSKENLIKHTKLTEPMKKSIDKAIKTYGLNFEYIKRIIERHSEKVEETKNKTEFKISVRTIAELFGQKKFKSEDLICSDYLDEIYKNEKVKEKKQFTRQIGDYKIQSL